MKGSARVPQGKAVQTAAERWLAPLPPRPPRQGQAPARSGLPARDTLGPLVFSLETEAATLALMRSYARLQRLLDARPRSARERAEHSAALDAAEELHLALIALLEEIVSSPNFSFLDNRLLRRHGEPVEEARIKRLRKAKRGGSR